jgi:hypothetical protein
MSKSTKTWDHLRIYPQPLKTYPIGKGTWQPRGAPLIAVKSVSGGHATLGFRSEHIGQDTVWDCSGLREVAEFFTELADQMEGKS